MPQTVPNRPMNGAVEPTVARNDRPSCRRDWTLSTARWICMVTQVDRSICSSRAPSWCWVALVPVSAMKRYGEPLDSCAEPAAIDGAFQNFWLVSFDCLKIFIWSSSLVTMMYHEPIDIRARMIRVPRDTTPPAHTALKPYGFSTSSCFAPAAAGAAAAGAAASAAGAAAGAAAS